MAPRRARRRECEEAVAACPRARLLEFGATRVSFRLNYVHFRQHWFYFSLKHEITASVAKSTQSRTNHDYALSCQLHNRVKPNTSAIGCCALRKGLNTPQDPLRSPPRDVFLLARATRCLASSGGLACDETMSFFLSMPNIGRTFK